MKTLRESLLDDGLVEKPDKIIKDEIKSFLKENYKGSIKISKEPNKDGKYEVSSTSDIVVINRNINSLTNGMFIWTTVGGYFSCSFCFKLESLEGAPKKVGGDFYCSFNKSLKSLENSPKEVGGNFYCSRCPDLTSLEGAPKKVGGDFHCYGCSSLKSLEGAPKVIDGNFDCSDCPSLNSLEGAPKEVGRDFYCHNCKVKFTKDDVKKVSNVKGKIKC